MVNVKDLTIEEKCGLLTGKGVFESQGIERVGLQGFRMSDGPSGVRDGAPAICYPSGCLLACSFDKKETERIGETLGKECSSRGVKLLLGPAQNLKRSPLCGRNFEYYSEDPCLSGELAGNFVKGLQKHTGACVKHFAANNQEYKRMTVNDIIFENALAETYLSSFERIVKKYDPDAVMSSYNKINGKYVGEDEELVGEYLRRQWGFNGIVISDWGAVDDKLQAVKAGMDMEMPPNPANTEKLLRSVQNGEIAEEFVDRCVERYLKVIERIKDRPVVTDFDKERAIEVCASVAAESMVLLKNEGVLPIDGRYKKIGVFGAFAKEPRIQGGGCANVIPYEIEKPIDHMKESFGGEAIIYEPTFRLDGEKDKELLAKAQIAAKECDICVIFAGLPEIFESEGYDREDLSIPENQIEAIEALCEVGKPTVVILSNGGMVTMEWDRGVGAVIESYLAGSAFARAITDVLSGKKTPCGRLAETVLHKKEDSSAYPYFGNKGNVAEYNEGLFVGYKYYNAKGVSVKYPFGYGLGYGKIEYTDVCLKNDCLRVELKNKGVYDDKETVQVYVGYKDGNCARPEGELKAFEKVFVPAGGRAVCQIPLNAECFRTFDRKRKKMSIMGGRYEITVRKNAMETVASFEIVRKSESLPVYGRNCEIGELLKTQEGRRIVSEELKPYLCLAIFGNFNAELEMKDGEAVDSPMFNSIMKNMPLRALVNLTAGRFTEAFMEEIIEKLNA